jgi:hypothetical protein
MKKRNIYKNTYLQFIIREAKRNKCTCEIKRNKHFRVRLTSLDNKKSEVMTVSCSPSDNKYEIFLEKELKICLNKINSSNT